MKLVLYLIGVFFCSCSLGMAQGRFFNRGDAIAADSLIESEDMSLKMLDGIHQYLDQYAAFVKANRNQYWKRDYSNHRIYEKSVTNNREHLRKILGVVDSLQDSIVMELKGSTGRSALLGETSRFRVYAVQWNVIAGVHGAGLLLQPKGKVKAQVIAIPDANFSPEAILHNGFEHFEGFPYGQYLATQGCQVIIPVILNRSNDGSGNQLLGVQTNQPQREWIYRQAYTFGRHIIGYELLKIRAVINWFESHHSQDKVPIGIIGDGEGALLSFFTAALDTRVQVSAVSGYFSSRDSLWKEPIYRNLFGFSKEFGDAEVASLIVPRSLIVIHSEFPKIVDPIKSAVSNARAGNSAAPGKLTTPPFSIVVNEINKAQQLAGRFKNAITFFHRDEKAFGGISKDHVNTFLAKLQVNPESKYIINEFENIHILDVVNRQEVGNQQLKELEDYTQGLIAVSREVRNNSFWKPLNTNSPINWKKSVKRYQDQFWNEIIGKLPTSNIKLNPKVKLLYKERTWEGYEFKLDVNQFIFNWGYLLLPLDLQEGERRPVVVVQHGGGGVPADMLDKNSVYKGIAEQFVNEGFVVVVPHFPWKHGDYYRSIQRKANPIGLSVFSIILSQHERLLAWLNSLPFVDHERIALYGLSWGGKVATRVPAILPQYKLAISSGDFNEWIWKNATTKWQNSYMYVPEYEMFDFDLASHFNYAEMAAMIAPRSFMVERGHDDTVGIDEWVAFEYAKVNRLYSKLKIPEKTQIEFFDGGHEINAKGTISFIKQQFNWRTK